MLSLGKYFGALLLITLLIICVLGPYFGGVCVFECLFIYFIFSIAYLKSDIAWSKSLIGSSGSSICPDFLFFHAQLSASRTNIGHFLVSTTNISSCKHVVHVLMCSLTSLVT